VTSPKSRDDRVEAIRRAMEELLRELEGVEDLRRQAEEAMAEGHLRAETGAAVMGVVEAAVELRRTLTVTMDTGTAPDTTTPPIPAKVTTSK
jgi:hypothetical protein